jgi:hypothetical protein
MAISLDGSAGITSPATKLAGTNSGVVTLAGATDAGTWNFTVPTIPGTSGYVLSTDGAGGTSWVAQTGGGGGGTYTRTTFTATAGQTNFTATYTVGYVQVYVNGILLNSADYTATSGTVIVLASAASAGDLVDVIALNIGTFTSGGYTRTNYTATAGQTSFTAAYTPGYVQVYLNGVLLDITDYTASSGSSIVLGTGAASGDAVTIVALTISGFSGNVTSVGTPTSGQLASWTGATSIQAFAPSATGDIPFSTNGTTFASTQKIVQGTSQATTSGTSIDFTGIPSWVKRVTVMLNSVSTNGSGLVIVQLGSTTFTTSGYTGGWSYVGAANFTGAGNYSNGFATGVSSAADTRIGSYIITNIGGNTWISQCVIAISNGTVHNFGAGYVTLSGVLDRVRLTTSTGTDTFDNGSVNILYE